MDWSQARIIDVSHHQDPAALDWQTAVASGCVGMIAKFTQGTGYLDDAAARHVRAALDGGVLLIGAYHFGDGADPAQQADWFTDQVDKIIPLDLVMLMLDVEKNPSGASMTVAGAATCATEIFTITGRWPWCYMGKYGPDGAGTGLPNATLAHCQLVLPAYSKKDPADLTGSLPAGWRQPVDGFDRGTSGTGVVRLWQYTDGTTNGGPYPGLGQVDQNQPIGFASIDELRAVWATGGAAPAKPVPPHGRDPVVMQQAVQERLTRLGLYTGPIDGDPGPGTRAGLQTYRDRYY